MRQGTNVNKSAVIGRNYRRLNTITSIELCMRLHQQLRSVTAPLNRFYVLWRHRKYYYYYYYYYEAFYKKCCNCTVVAAFAPSCEVLAVVFQSVVIKFPKFASSVLDDLHRFVAFSRFIIITAQGSHVHLLAKIDDFLDSGIT